MCRGRRAHALPAQPRALRRSGRGPAGSGRLPEPATRDVQGIYARGMGKWDTPSPSPAWRAVVKDSLASQWDSQDCFIRWGNCPRKERPGSGGTSRTMAGAEWSLCLATVACVCRWPMGQCGAQTSGGSGTTQEPGLEATSLPTPQAQKEPHVLFFFFV